MSPELPMSPELRNLPAPARNMTPLSTGLPGGRWGSGYPRASATFGSTFLTPNCNRFASRFGHRFCAGFGYGFGSRPGYRPGSRFCDPRRSRLGDRPGY